MKVKVSDILIQDTLHTNRIIGHIKGDNPGPTLIFVGGIHGNEPAGVLALQHVMNFLQNNNISVRGNVYAIAGNLWALERGKRYHMRDLNRLWTWKNIEKIKANQLRRDSEDIDQLIDIYNTIHTILNEESGPFYFFDLHTTSSNTVPFLTVNDSLLNRKFTKQFPSPIILGIEEYLDGPLLSYINELGYVAFGFEGGQHHDDSSIDNHVAFIYLSLVFSGCLQQQDIPFEKYYSLLAEAATPAHHIYEIYFQHKIAPDEVFEMRPGFDNFQAVFKNQEIAVSNGKILKAKKNGRIFMPLYQKEGDDGFFAIRSSSTFFLWLSALCRKAHLDRLLPFLPGIHWASKSRNELIVNRKVARFYTKKIFHLLGYRSRKLNKTHFSVKNRETASRHNEYRKEIWY